jgi:hypothetical protein
VSSKYHWLNGVLVDSPVPQKLGPELTLDQLCDQVLGPVQSPRPKTRDTAPLATLPDPPPLALPTTSPSSSSSARTTWATQPQGHPPPAAQLSAVADAQYRNWLQKTQSQGLLRPQLQRVPHRALHLAPVPSAAQVPLPCGLQLGYATQPDASANGSATACKRSRKRDRGDRWYDRCRYQRHKVTKLQHDNKDILIRIVKVTSSVEYILNTPPECRTRTDLIAIRRDLQGILNDYPREVAFACPHLAP